MHFFRVSYKFKDATGGTNSVAPLSCSVGRFIKSIASFIWLLDFYTYLDLRFYLFQCSLVVVAFPNSAFGEYCDCDRWWRKRIALGHWLSLCLCLTLISFSPLPPSSPLLHSDVGFPCICPWGEANCRLFLYISSLSTCKNNYFFHYGVVSIIFCQL